MILAAVNNSCISVSGRSHAKGSLFVNFDPDNGKIELRQVFKPGYSLYGPFHYSEWTDASTGNPFASYSDLIAWIEVNLYSGGDSGASSIGYMKILYVVAAAVAEDEVTAGATIEHEFLDTGSVLKAEVNGTNYYAADLTHNTGSPGDLTLTNPARDFIDGDVLLIIKTP